ncbi:hypothetical protein LPU83_pLPU83d_1363 (plasmid) [Rhizobium favelukesii]|uniref:Uncharacterized protein n=1 Tax=Rhizobium favelukesii TaxID=348824 RepID=W6RVQ8_9HYPH|nr:hypothetical protein LPU83_pLPU83d_1363 [Rhizobium favelukesii]
MGRSAGSRGGSFSLGFFVSEGSSAGLRGGLSLIRSGTPGADVGFSSGVGTVVGVGILLCPSKRYPCGVVPAIDGWLRKLTPLALLASFVLRDQDRDGKNNGHHLAETQPQAQSPMKKPASAAPSVHYQAFRLSGTHGGFRSTGANWQINRRPGRPARVAPLVTQAFHTLEVEYSCRRRSQTDCSMNRLPELLLGKWFRQPHQLGKALFIGKLCISRCKHDRKLRE